MPETFAPSNKNMSFVSANCYFDRFDASGNKTGLIHLGEVTDLAFRPTDDIKEHYEHMTAARKLYDSVLAQRKVESDLTLWELNNVNAALITSGTQRTFTQTGGSITGEQLNASLALGKVYQTAERNISSYTVKQGATTLVEGTDYEVLDASAGLIHILPTGAATEGTAVTIDYTSAAIASLATISPYDQPQVDGSLLILETPLRGPKKEYRLWHVALFPKEWTNLISDDYRSAGVTMAIYSDESGSYGGDANYPYGIIFDRG